MSCGGFPDGSCARRGVPSRPRWPRRAAGRLSQTRLCEPATRVFEGSEGHQGRPSRPPMSCEAFSEGSCAGRGVPLRPRWPRCAVGRLGHTRLCESPTRVFRGVRWAAPPSHPRPTPSNPVQAPGTPAEPSMTLGGVPSKATARRRLVGSVIQDSNVYRSRPLAGARPAAEETGPSTRGVPDCREGVAPARKQHVSRRTRAAFGRRPALRYELGGGSACL